MSVFYSHVSSLRARMWVEYTPPESYEGSERETFHRAGLELADDEGKRVIASLDDGIDIDIWVEGVPDFAAAVTGALNDWLADDGLKVGEYRGIGEHGPVGGGAFRDTHAWEVDDLDDAWLTGWSDD